MIIITLKTEEIVYLIIKFQKYTIINTYYCKDLWVVLIYVILMSYTYVYKSNKIKLG